MKEQPEGRDPRPGLPRWTLWFVPLKWHTLDDGTVVYDEIRILGFSPEEPP